ncbi:hypothetical protein [Calditerricola satsumensis]|uniref:hypothetical protein n=1 Tax=Calditerricola satsumensis TaxID=373054 RepID=UPI0012EE6EE0|nr:hypothetical protein [Calditerricola satsumensis]
MLVFDTVSKSFGKRVVLTNCSFQLPTNKLLEQPMANSQNKPTPVAARQVHRVRCKSKLDMWGWSVMARLA